MNDVEIRKNKQHFWSVHQLLMLLELRLLDFPDLSKYKYVEHASQLAQFSREGMESI
jgi:hypothetical protein